MGRIASKVIRSYQEGIFPSICLSKISPNFHMINQYTLSLIKNDDKLHKRIIMSSTFFSIAYSQAVFFLHFSYLEQ